MTFDSVCQCEGLSSCTGPVSTQAMIQSLFQCPWVCHRLRFFRTLWTRTSETIRCLCGGCRTPRSQPLFDITCVRTELSGNVPHCQPSTVLGKVEPREGYWVLNTASLVSRVTPQVRRSVYLPGGSVCSQLEGCVAGRKHILLQPPRSPLCVWERVRFGDRGCL